VGEVTHESAVCEPFAGIVSVTAFEFHVIGTSFKNQ
jgi:hypothetical protein